MKVDHKRIEKYITPLPPLLVDSHCHLDSEGFPEDLHDVITRAKTGGLRLMIAIGSGNGLKSAEEILALVGRDERIYGTAGLHPHDARMFNTDVEARLDTLLQNERIVAVGETGLDYYYTFSSRSSQMDAFRSQIRLAHKNRLPLVLHVRDAEADVMAMLDSEQGWDVGGVFHCYSGSVELARQIVAKGFYISIPGIITFKKPGDLVPVVEETPMDRLLIETDSPYLAPDPFRGSRNEPAFVRFTAQKIAEIKGLSFEDVARITAVNTARCFRLPEHVREFHEQP